MTTSLTRNDSFILGLLIGAVFIIDLLTPLGIADGILYILVVLCTLPHRNTRLTFGIALGCSVLTLLGLAWSPEGGEWWKVIWNRGLALFAIWTTAILGYRHQRQAQTIGQHDKALQTFMNHMPSACFTFDHEGRILSWNQAAERIYGYSPAEAIGRYGWDLIVTPETRADTQRIMHGVFQGQSFVNQRWHDRNKQGEPGWRLGNLFPVFDEKGHVAYGLNMNVDITSQKAAEECLTAQHRLRTILDSMTNFVGIGTPEGIVVDCNQAPLQLAGLQREDVIGKHLTDTYWVNYSPLVQQQVRDILQRVAHGETVREDIRVRMGETTYIMVDACYVPVCDDTGHVIQIVHSGIDVTARRAAETALQKSQRNLQAILDHSPNLIFMKDLEGRYLRINKTFEKAFGLSESAVLGHCDHELFPPAQAEQFHAHDHLVLKHTSLIESEERLLYGQTPHTNFVQRFPIQDEQGTLYALGGIATDITERKQAEEALKKSEERFRKYFESGLVGMAIIAVDHTWIAVNDELCHMVGYSQEELRRITWTTLTHPDDRAEGDVLIHDLLHNQRESFSFIHRYVHKNGSIVYVKIHANAVRDAHGQVEYLMVMIQDLTKQKEAEAATRAAERLALAAMNALSAHICVLDEQGTILMVNNNWNAFALANGGDPAAVGVGANYFSFVPRMAGGQIPDTAQMLFNMLEVLEGRKQEFSYDYPCVSPTSQRWFTCRVSRIEETHPMRIVVAHQDIHEQKQAELQLREAETFTKSIVDNLPNMIFVKEAQSLRFVQINKAGEHLLGITRQDLLGKSDFDLFPTEEAEFFTSQDRKVLTERTLLDIPEEPIQTMHAGIRVLHTKKLPICDSFGTPQFLLGISEDITSRKAMEDQIRRHANELEAEVDRRATRIQELEQRRMQVEKLAALSQIAAGVAHEINNPLASIAQALTLVKRAIPPDHPKFKYTQKMQACIDRMTHITRQLYTLYRPSTSQPDPIDIAQVIQSAVDIMHPIAEKKQLRLQVTHSWTSSPIQAEIAPGDMIQILCNLIQNAVDASSPLSDIGITTSLTDRTLTITVVDKGMGISPDVLPHIFDPFFTTKYGAQSVGLGLGLAISKNLLSSMGGQLDCSTKEGKGTTFSIILPLPPEYS